MVWKIPKEFIIDCGSAILKSDGSIMHNMCFFLALHYSMILNNIKCLQNKVDFYDFCCRISTLFPKPGTMISTQEHRQAIQTLAQHYDITIRIYTSINIQNYNYICDGVFDEIGSGEKMLYLLCNINHYKVFIQKPESIGKKLEDIECLQIINQTSQASKLIDDEQKSIFMTLKHYHNTHEKQSKEDENFAILLQLSENTYDEQQKEFERFMEKHKQNKEKEQLKKDEAYAQQLQNEEIQLVQVLKQQEEERKKLEKQQEQQLAIFIKQQEEERIQLAKKHQQQKDDFIMAIKLQMEDQSQNMKKLYERRIKLEQERILLSAQYQELEKKYQEAKKHSSN